MKKEFIITFFIIITINFFLPRLMPGDPFIFLSVEDGEVSSSFSEEQINRYKSYYGLDKPLAIQYKNYITDIFKGDLGYSIYFKEKVSKLIGKRILWTLFVSGLALILSILLGIFLAIISVANRKNKFDHIIYLFSMLISEIPSFLIGLFLLFIFSAKMRLFPLAGGKTPFIHYHNFIEQIYDLIKFAFLPIVSLILVNTGSFYMVARNSMITVINKDYITTAKGKGLSKKEIYSKYVLKNALLPIITKIFMSFGNILGSAVLVENVFNYPGIGTLMRQAVSVRDYILLQGILVITALIILIMNFLSEIFYRKIDPRVKQ